MAESEGCAERNHPKRGWAQSPLPMILSLQLIGRVWADSWREQSSIMVEAALETGASGNRALQLGQSLHFCFHSLDALERERERERNDLVVLLWRLYP